MRNKILFFILSSFFSLAAVAQEMPSIQYQVSTEEHQQADGSYTGSRDLLIINKLSHSQIKINMGYPNSSLLHSVVLPDNRTLFAVGMSGGTGKLWLAKYDLLQKKRVAQYDTLINAPEIVGIPQNLIWNNLDKVLELTIDAPEGLLIFCVDTNKNKITKKLVANEN